MSEVFLYLAFNLTMNIFAVLVIKHGSAALSFLVSTLRMPLSALAFGSTLIMGSEAVTPQLHDLLSLVVILLGLCSYRMGARQLKRQQKEESAMSQDPIPSPTCASPSSSPGSTPGFPGTRPRGSEWRFMPVFATGSINSGQPQFVLVHAPKPQARSADAVRRTLIGRLGVGSPLHSPQFRDRFSPGSSPEHAAVPETKGSGSLGYFWVQALGDSLVIAPEDSTFEFTCLNRRRWIDVTADTFRAQHAYACAAVLLAGSASTYPLLVLVFRWGPTCPKEHFRTSAIAQSSRRHEC
eukprot:s929_g8.t2